MKKSKIIFAILFIFIFSASCLFFIKTFFPGETYIFMSRFSNFSAKSTLVPKENIESEKTDLKSLLENGAVFNDSLLLINEENPVSENYEPVLAEYKGIYMNDCALKAYKELSSSVKNKFKNSIYIMSAFRTPEEQASIIESGNEYAASVNSSEHLTGLALDVYVKYHAGMGFLDSDEGQFVNSFCHKYGFIIRYPDYGEKITGIPYEPWHLRYVGLPHSEIIMNNKLTLEEYINQFVPGAYYFYGDYIITRQSDLNSIPAGISEIVISPDNTGYYIITGKY